jgi:stage III sporulation protein SpoIIIAA
VIRETDIDLNVLVDVIPERFRSEFLAQENVEELLEVVLDLGRQPEARFLGQNKLLEVDEVTKDDLKYAISKIVFGDFINF